MMDTCDSCGDAVPEDMIVRDSSWIELVVPLEEQDDNEGLGRTFESKAYDLCHTCQHKIIDFIEGEDRERTRIDKVYLETMVDKLERDAETFEEIAQELKDLEDDDITEHGNN